MAGRLIGDILHGNRQRGYSGIAWGGGGNRSGQAARRAAQAPPMKKKFALVIPDRKPGLVLDAVKHEIRKYLKRERRKPLPEGVDFWDFDCRVGKAAEDATVKHPGDLEKAIAEVQAAGGAEVYVEILAKPGHRVKKEAE